MWKKYLFFALVFLLVRTATIYIYTVKYRAYYYYSMVANQFSIADAAYQGHFLAMDDLLSSEVVAAAERDKKFIPIEEYKNYKRSNIFVTFPSEDIPGYGYLIAYTSKYLAGELTSRYAFAVQVAAELLSILIFMFCIASVFGDKTALAAGYLYVFFFPFIWPIASLPMRDIFVLPVFASYMAGIMIFLKRKGTAAAAYAILLTAVACALLWIRPSGYYYFFAAAPLVLFVRNQPLKSRFIVFAVSIVFPLLIFGQVFRAYNLRHYGTPETHFIGRCMWEDMGLVKDNPYGFEYDDTAIIRWTKARGYNYSYASPQMNKVLEDYVIEVVKKDPVFLLESFYVKTILMMKSPLETTPPFKMNDIRIVEYVKHPGNIIKHPLDFVVKTFRIPYSLAVFYSGIIIFIIMLVLIKDKRVEMMILFYPFIYTVASQPIHFQTRYLTAGAWPLVLPFAWLIVYLSEKKKSKITNLKLEKSE